MTEEYKIEYSEKPEWGVIGPAISEYNTQKAGDDNSQTVCFVLHNSQGEIVGGAIGVVYWDWFSLDLMWVREDLRGRGYGGQLLELAEEKAREHGATKVHLDTFSFQAPGFYEKSGYQIFGELDEFPAGHQRYYMTKKL